MFEDRGSTVLTNKCSAYKKVVSRITNSCVEQAVIVTIIVVLVNSEHWHKSSVNNKEFNWN